MSCSLKKTTYSTKAFTPSATCYRKKCFFGNLEYFVLRLFSLRSSALDHSATALTPQQEKYLRQRCKAEKNLTGLKPKELKNVFFAFNGEEKTFDGFLPQNGRCQIKNVHLSFKASLKWSKFPHLMVV